MTDHKFYIDIENEIEIIDSAGSPLTDPFASALEITDYVIEAHWFNGFREPNTTIADENELEITLNNDDKRFSPEYSSGPYYGKLQPGRLISVWDENIPSPPGFHRLVYLGVISEILPEPKETSEQRCVIRATGLKSFLEATTLQIPLISNVDMNDVIRQVFETANTFPLVSNKYARLDTPGRNQLNVSTTRLAIYLESFEDGVQEIPFVGDSFDSSATAMDYIHEAVKAERGKFYFSRSGVPVTWNRHRLLYDLTTPTVIPTPMEYEYSYGDEVYTSINYRVYPRKISTNSNDIVYRSETDISVPPNGSVTVNAQYSDDTDIKVAAINPYWDSTGFTAEGGVQVTGMELGANSAKITFSNTTSEEKLVTAYTIRGIKITISSEINIYIESPNIQTFKKRQMQVDSKLLDFNSANVLAPFELARFSNAVGRIKSIKYVVRDSTYRNFITNNTIGSIIAIPETQTGHNANYVIIGEEFNVMDGQQHVEVTYYVEQLTNLKFIMLDTTNRNKLDSGYGLSV